MSNSIPSRQDWVFGHDIDTFDKKAIKQLYITKLLNITQQIFKYSNLPDTIPEKDLELILQVNGSATIAKVNDKLYAFRGGLGGTPNVYYLPTISVVANPALKFSKTLTIDEDCVVILNDALYQGLMPNIAYNSALLAECDISFKFAAVNMRIPALVTAPDSITALSAKKVFEQVEEGKSLELIIDEGFEDKIKAFDFSNRATNITHLIELKQYILGSFYQSLGIQSQFNMKREAINEAEAALSEDILFPLIDEMLEQRQLGLERVNKMFGTDIKVELSSIWKQLRKQQEIAYKLEESEVVANLQDGGDVDEQDS